MANITGVNPPVLNDTDYVDKIKNSLDAIDLHDHTSGKGVAISASALANGSVTEAKQEVVLANASKFMERDVTGAVVSGVHAVPSGAVVGTTDTQTLANKTIDGDLNTVQDLALTSLKTNITDASKFIVRDASGIPASNTKAVPSGVVVGTTDTQTLSAKTLTTPIVDYLHMTDGTTPSTPSSGSTKIYTKTDGKAYKLTSAGVEQEIGSGSGSGTINYISANPDAETSTTGWASYADAAGTAPVDGTGGSPTLTFTRSTSLPLRGTASFLITTTAANLQGEGASFVFAISDADQAKIMAVSFDYKIASGTYADGDMTVYIVDVDTGAIIQPTGYSILNISSGTAKQIATFQTSASSTTYRLCFHRAAVTASAMTMKIDNVQVGPQIVQYGAPITDFVAYTPTVTGLGTITSVNMYWARVGDSIRIRGTLRTGTPTATGITITLPTGLSYASTRSGEVEYFVAGTVARIQGTVNPNYPSASGGPFAAYIRSNATKVSVAVATSGGDWSEGSGSTLFGTGDKVSVELELPIAGWSSIVQMSNDADTRVCAALISGDPASASSGNPIIVPTVGFDSHGAYNSTTGRYTVPVPGVYKMYGALQSASSATTLTIYKNAVSASLAGNLDSNGEATFCSAVNCVTGDIIDLRPGGTVDATTMSLNIERLSGPSAIAASETVAASYSASAVTSIANGSTTTVDFATKNFDTHNAVTTGASWKFTAPISGKYLVTAQVASVSGGGWGVGEEWNIFTGVSAYNTRLGQSSAQAAHTIPMSVNGSIVLNMLAGQFIQIGIFQNSGAAINSTSDPVLSHVDIVRVGN